MDNDGRVENIINDLTSIPDQIYSPPLAENIAFLVQREPFLHGKYSNNYLNKGALGRAEMFF